MLAAVALRVWYAFTAERSRLRRGSA